MEELVTGGQARTSEVATADGKREGIARTAVDKGISDWRYSTSAVHVIAIDVMEVVAAANSAIATALNRNFLNTSTAMDVLS